MFQLNLFHTALGNRIKLYMRVYSPPLLILHILYAEMLYLIVADLSLQKKKKPTTIYCCLPPVCPTWAPPEASLCLGCAACGSLRWDPGLYIEPLRTLRVQSFHSTSERLLPSMRNAALALITSHDQDHSVVSGWNWQAGLSLTLSKRARWEVLPAKTCVSTQRETLNKTYKKKLAPRH